MQEGRPESEITPQILEERRNLHEKMAGTLAVGVYLKTSEGTMRSHIQHPGDNFSIQRNTALTHRELVGIVMPLGDNQLIALSTVDLTASVLEVPPDYDSTSSNQQILAQLDLDNVQGLSMSQNNGHIHKNVTYALLGHTAPTPLLRKVADSGSTSPDEFQEYLQKALDYAKMSQQERRMKREQAVARELELFRELFKPE